LFICLIFFSLATTFTPTNPIEEPERWTMLIWAGRRVETFSTRDWEVMMQQRDEAMRTMDSHLPKQLNWIASKQLSEATRQQ